MFRPPSLALTLFLSFWAPFALAQTPDPLLDSARALMSQQRAQQAYELLEARESQRAQDADYNFLLGIAAIDAGHTTRAIMALERAVEIRPEDNLARAELARAYLAAGEPVNARAELQRARRSAMPAEAAAAIDRVLGSLEQDPVKGQVGAWRAYVEAFAGHDSNVNSATAAGQFALPAFGGIVFSLDADNRARSDAFTGAGAGLGLQLPLAAGWELNAALNARGVYNRHADQQDNRQLDGNVGLSFATGEHVLSAALQANTYDIDSNRYRRASGLSGQWQYKLGPASQLSVFSQWSRLAYAADAARDADRTVLGLGYARAFDEGRQIAYASAYGAHEKPRTDGFDNYGHHAAGVRLGAEASLGARTTAFAAVQYEKRNYGGSEPFFDASRRDRQLDITTGVHFVPAPEWRITPQLSHVRAASDVVLYEYRRTVWQITVRREFK